MGVVRIVFALVGLIGLACGYLGLDQYMRGTDTKPGDIGVSNVIYYDLELALLQSTPLQTGGPMPALLQVGRFCAPSVLLYPIVELVVALTAPRIRRTRLRRAGGHVVVCGTTRPAQLLTERLRAAGSRVIVVASDPPEPMAADIVTGDPRVPITLRAAGVTRAERVYACLEAAEHNAEIAAAVEQVRADRDHPKRVHVLVPDLQLCSALRARHWSLDESGAHRLGFFNPDELAAQATVRADDGAFTGRAPWIAVVDTGAFARSLLVEFARQWAVRGGARQEPARALLIGADAPAVAGELAGQYAFLAAACRIEPRTEPIEQILCRLRPDSPGDGRTGADRAEAQPPALRRLYLCQQDEAEALKCALDTVTRFQSVFARAVVRLDRMTGMAVGFGAYRDGVPALFDAFDGRLRLVDVTTVGCDPRLIEDDLEEWLARACHQRYLADQFGSGAEPGASAVLLPWEQLPEQYRTANRDQAAHVGRKLAAIGCVLSPRRPGDRPFAFRLGEVDRLAELEHRRWTAERLRAGWVCGAVRDDAARRHPALVPWSALPEAEREKDRRVVLDLAPMLADAGLTIVRTAGGEPGSGYGADGRDRRPPSPDAAESAVGPMAADAGATSRLSPADSPLPARSP